MVILPDRRYDNPLHPRKVYAAIFQTGNGIVVRLENDPVVTGNRDGKLADPISPELMEMSRRQ